MTKSFIGREEDKIFLFSLLLILILVAIAIVNAPRVHAAGLTFSASTTISFTGDTWTIKPISTADSVQVGTSNIVLTLANGDSFTVHVNSKSFTATGQSANATVSNTPCYTNYGDGVGKLTITANQAETVTVASSTCSFYEESFRRRIIVPSPDATIYGPTPTSIPTPTPIPPTPGFSLLPAKPTATEIQLAINEVLQRIAQLQANPSVPNILGQLQQLVVRIAEIQQAVVGGARAAPPARGPIDQPLYQGLKSAQVNTLQDFLRSQGSDIYPEGLVTGYFGPLTRGAVERFQAKYGIANKGDVGYGFVGPKTRAKINSLSGQ